MNPIVLKLALIKMFFGEGNMKTSNLDIVRSVNFQATKTTSVPTTLFQKVNDSQISQNRSNQVMFQIKNNINNENNRLSISPLGGSQNGSNQGTYSGLISCIRFSASPSAPSKSESLCKNRGVITINTIKIHNMMFCLDSFFKFNHSFLLIFLD